MAISSKEAKKLLREKGVVKHIGERIEELKEDDYSPNSIKNEIYRIEGKFRFGDLQFESQNYIRPEKGTIIFNDHSNFSKPRPNEYIKSKDDILPKCAKEYGLNFSVNGEVRFDKDSERILDIYKGKAYRGLGVITLPQFEINYRFENADQLLKEVLPCFDLSMEPIEKNNAVGSLKVFLNRLFQ